MERWRTSSRLPMALGALGRPEVDPAVRRLAEAFGGEPAAVRERLVGAPAYRSQRLMFAAGGEIILHDGAVAAVLLHLEPTEVAPHGLGLSEWIAGADNRATLYNLKEAIGAPRHFAGIGTPYFTLDGGYAQANFKDRRGWNDPGNLVSITITAHQPGLACSPEDDVCPSCSDLLVRSSDSSSGVDVDATIAALTQAVSAGLLTEDLNWARLADLRALDASGLMTRVESQLTCTTCRRISCFTLFRDSEPTFVYSTKNDARRRPLEAIPPVEQWGDEARIAQERDAMHYVDHEPGAWFLVEQQGVLYLQARYVVTSMVDDSALIRLNDAEVDAYLSDGHASISALARRIHDGFPHLEKSAFYERNLFRGAGDQALRDAVAAAIVNHTWLAQQRRAT